MTPGSARTVGRLVNGRLVGEVSVEALGDDVEIAYQRRDGTAAREFVSLSYTAMHFGGSRVVFLPSVRRPGCDPLWSWRLCVPDLSAGGLCLRE